MGQLFVPGDKVKPLTIKVKLVSFPTCLDRGKRLFCILWTVKKTKRRTASKCKAENLSFVAMSLAPRVLKKDRRAFKMQESQWQGGA